MLCTQSSDISLQYLTHVILWTCENVYDIIIAQPNFTILATYVLKYCPTLIEAIYLYTVPTQFMVFRW